MLGHANLGTGDRKVVVLNDWLCDTSSWDAARPYIDDVRFRWAFSDLRGYGRSRGQRSAFTAEEGASDVLALADALGWQRFAIVGHSMSSLVALHLAQHASDRVARAVLITPPPPSGFGYDDETLEAVRALGFGDDERRTAALKQMLGERLSERWLSFKLARWRATSDAEAVAGYVPLFGRRGVPEPTIPVACPVLAVTGEEDAEPMRSEAVTRAFGAIAERLTVAPIAQCGHYPMQEAPPLLVATVERFLAEA
ncbi:MAG TPA: alpha/beta hydrolase [Polyangiaceae bacterium]|nr:alpha/beta hydrolase [Polyangiaceae bacterium]